MTAPVSHQKRRDRSATNAIEIKQNCKKINEGGRYSAAHNGLVAGSSPAGPTTLRPSGYAWQSHAGPKDEAWCPAKLERSESEDGRPRTRAAKVPAFRPISHPSNVKQRWTAVRSPAACSARVMHQACPSEIRGHRECRCSIAPAALRAMKKARKQVTTGTPKTSGIPCAMVLRLIRDLPGVPGFLATVARELVHELDPSVGRSGPHDFAVRKPRHSPGDAA